MTKRYAITLIPGDGIGPEVTAQAVKVLEATGVVFEWDEQAAGMAAVGKFDTPIPDQTIESIRGRRLALKGPLTTPVGGGYRSVNVALRKEFELYANVRPTRSILPGGKFPDVDLVLVFRPPFLANFQPLMSLRQRLVALMPADHPLEIGRASCRERV